MIVAFLGLAAWCDWRMRKIPNLLVFPFMLTGLLVQCYRGEAVAAIGGIATAFLITLLPVLCRGMGMGDQKLLLALGAWTDYLVVYQVVIGSFLSCLVLLLCAPRTWKKLLHNLQVASAGWRAHREIWLPDPSRSALSFPYAVHLFLAFIVLECLG
jgi:prepilin peptidase CpaA